MGCKGTCTRYQATKPVGIGRYAASQKRCQICEIFISWQGLWCPCCGYRLRSKPRNLKWKSKLRKEILGKKKTILQVIVVDGVEFQKPVEVDEEEE